MKIECNPAFDKGDGFSEMFHVVAPGDVIVWTARQELMMSTTASRPIHSKPLSPPPPSLPPLENGEKLGQPTFHARYKAMPENVRAELIEGIVYMASPVSLLHGTPHSHLTTWVGTYEAATPVVSSAVDATAILGQESEPQPDVALLTIGGQTSVTPDGFVSGAPELACDIANSTESIDLHA